MHRLLYIHGFLSSSQSVKARQTHQWLQQHRPDWEFICPDLDADPRRAMAQLLAAASGPADSRLHCVGSSLGGFWATCLAERLGCKSVLINPAVRPHTRFKSLVGQTLSHYYTGEPFVLTSQALEFLASVSPAIRHPERYWVLLQTGDETLDYRDAVEFYGDSRLEVEPGGNHAFTGFAERLPAIIDFLEQ